MVGGILRVMRASLPARGYIDEPERSKSNSNQVRTLGGRLAVRGVR